jgi:hypothetical protein
MPNDHRHQLYNGLPKSLVRRRLSAYGPKRLLKDVRYTAAVRREAEPPLSGEKQTFRQPTENDAIDPERTRSLLKVSEQGAG